MKTSIVIRIVCWSLAAILLTGLLVAGLGWHLYGGDGFWNGFFRLESLSGTYTEAGSYTVSVASVRSLDIDWVSGSVTVSSYDGEDIQIVERAQRPLKDKEKLRYELEGSELKIDYTKPKVFSLFSTVPIKQLEVNIPKSLADKLTDLDVDSASADIVVRGLNAQDISLETTSGELLAEDVISSELSLNSVSGEIRAHRVQTEELSAETVSGNAVLSGAFSKMKIESVSGDLTATDTRCPSELKSTSVSGNTTVTIPENDGFTVRYSKVSGDFHCDFPVSTDGDRHVYENGGADFRMETVSGDLTIRKSA